MNYGDDMLCPHCGQTHPIEARFCPSTGQSLPEKSFCPACGNEIQADWIRCVHCGWELKEGIPVILPRQARSKRQVSRKGLTCSIVAVIILVGIGTTLWLMRDLLVAQIVDRVVTESPQMASDTPVLTVTPTLISLSPTSLAITEQTVLTTQPPSYIETPTVTRSPTAKVITTPWRACPDARLSQLSVGMQAYVSNDPPVPNRVRALPNTEARILGWIYSGEKVEVLDGPACANIWVWWKVRSLETGLTGWTSEGDQNDYWLLPLP
jgi:uncharacterized protein YbaR (Trm112 family)